MKAALLAALLLPAAAHATPVAFPGAEGAGAQSLGGRGGRVIKVTTLADAGPGSLRAAIEAKGPRTILFDLSGTIHLASPLRILEPRVTIAGQTAPGDGITLADHTLEIAADDVVIRYIRARLGDVSKTEADAIWINGGHRIILDHVSASWSVDETLSASAAYSKGQGFWDLTVQWSIIANSLTRSLHAKGAHGYGSLIRGGHGSKISFHHNLWANHGARMPRPGNYELPDKDAQGAFFDFRSNVFYNWGGDHAGYNADHGSLARYNFVDNCYRPGPQSRANYAFDEGNEAAHAFFAGNSMAGQIPADPWSLVKGIQPPGYRLPEPVAMPPVTPDPAPQGCARVLASAGASLVRDGIDKAVIAGVRSGTGHQIDSQTEMGGWPVLHSKSAPRDSDGDGIPDAREVAHGLDPHRDDGAQTNNRDGYTHLEDYLADLVR